MNQPKRILAHLILSPFYLLAIVIGMLITPVFLIFWAYETLNKYKTDTP